MNQDDLTGWDLLFPRLQAVIWLAMGILIGLMIHRWFERRK